MFFSQTGKPTILFSLTLILMILGASFTGLCAFFASPAVQKPYFIAFLSGLYNMTLIHSLETRLSGDNRQNINIGRTK